MVECHPNTVEPWEFISPTPDSGIFEIVGTQIQFMKIEIPTAEELAYELFLPDQPSIQDFSIRFTLSERPFGVPIEWHGQPHASIPPHGIKIAVRDYTLDLPKNPEYRTFDVMPGQYYINIQNIANAKATWGFRTLTITES